jgi:hypothetical protein
LSLIEGKTGNTLELAHILGHDGEVVVQRSCRNEDIWIANQFTSIAQVAANERKRGEQDD